MRRSMQHLWQSEVAGQSMPCRKESTGPRPLTCTVPHSQRADALSHSDCQLREAAHSLCKDWYWTGSSRRHAAHQLCAPRGIALRPCPLGKAGTPERTCDSKPSTATEPAWRSESSLRAEAEVCPTPYPIPFSVCAQAPLPQPCWPGGRAEAATAPMACASSITHAAQPE